ncbi:TonB-dependent receptor [Reichenbachiella versicolor]|uniref:TonB-dependent receptor n=1 Tax=Reichenbachiella versicolor TaxID=1821036 RepID=UPI000D6E55EB|nr:TonB-dependent receptor [Reichenbachiella versicolor]
MKKNILTLLLATLPLFVFSKEFVQTVRGTILDQDSKTPLIGATIQIVGSNPVIGTVTDINGQFRLNEVPIGRVSIAVSYIGYDQKVLSNLVITSAKETVLEIPLLESVEKLDEIVISAADDKSEAMNEMSIVSAKTFSVDETKRFAGSFADPARMVSSYAGVTNDPEGNNDIVVRGNSPKGILWRLEGLEIPNPNHFANEGATGGPINAMNPNMLSNSDFLTGAFAPEYGNALSGVFDMRLRKGNNEQKEYTAGLSTLGVDFTVEGPFRKNYDGSYLANYRYSSLALISRAGIMDFGGIPEYQDMSFNIYLPMNKKHYFSFFGLGGLSSISTEDEDNDTGELSYRDKFSSNMGTLGLTHNFLMSKRTFLKSTLALSGTRLLYFGEEPDNNGMMQVYNDADFQKSYMRALASLNHKFNAQHKLEAGLIYTRLGYDMQQLLLNEDTDILEEVMEDEGSSYTTQGFTTWKYRINRDLTLISGLHYIHFGLNNSYSLEPRGAIRWQFKQDKALFLGVGVHSRLESLAVYLGKESQDDGTLIQNNKNLETSKALHYVLGYDQNIGDWMHAKIELYYQSLYNVPIENVTGSTFSLLNSSDDYVTEPLVNDGTGRNYGIEMTLERYLHNGMYFMTTGSVYRSLYTAMDGIERNTAFAGNYTFNVLGGKEWKYGNSQKQKVFFVNLKTSIIGAKPYTPILYEESINKGYEVRDDSKPFTVKSDDIFILNISIGTRKNKKNTTQEFKIDLQNATFQQAPVDLYYIDSSQEIVESPQLPFFPTISWSISF